MSGSLVRLDRHIEPQDAFSVVAIGGRFNLIEGGSTGDPDTSKYLKPKQALGSKGPLLSEGRTFATASRLGGSVILLTGNLQSSEAAYSFSMTHRLVL